MERPHSRYTREKTWAALYSQHINAGYAWVPFTATNNSIAVIRCVDGPEKTQVMQDALLKQITQSDMALPEKARLAVVLAKSSDYHRYQLAKYDKFKLVICGLHDSYLPVVVWETHSNMRYGARETAVAIGSPEFEKARSTQFGHNILVGALICGDKTAIAYRDAKDSSNDQYKLPGRTRRRLIQEVQELQHKHYQGRPLAFLTEAERQERGAKISEGLKRYHAQRHLRVV